MKKIIVVFALLLSLSAIAQNFPERRPQLLIGKELKVTPFKITEYEKGYKKFYSDIEMRKTYLEKDKYSSFTPVEQLEGRVFKVTAVEASDPTEKNYSRLTLVDETKGETLYYKYDRRFEKNFHFEVVGGLKLPADLYCDFITEKKDKFTDEIIYSSELLQGMVFTKIKKGAGAKYFISVSDYKEEQYLGKKGVIILLENNKRIDRPDVVIEVGPESKYGFSHSATFELTLKEVNLLIDNKMTDVRLYTFDGEVGYQDYFKGVFGCLVTK
ncbi:hypothetical protein D3C87_395480 [compost metagenome]